MGNINRPVILKEDMDLFIRIAKHGFVDIEYIQMFAYPGRQKRTINDRIKQLESYQFLSIKKTFIPPDYTTSFRAGYRIVSLGNRAIHLLSNNDFEVIDNMKAIQNSSPYRMYHQVQVATVCDIIQDRYGYSKSNWEVYKILNEREAYLEDALNQPDALILFRPKNSADNLSTPLIAVFLEIERSYASPRSLERKIKGYRFAITSKLYKKKMNYNIVDSRVLFVAQTQNQKQALVSKILNCEQHADFNILIAGYQEITQVPLDAIYISPFNVLNKYKLLGKIDKV